MFVEGSMHKNTTNIKQCMIWLNTNLNIIIISQVSKTHAKELECGATHVKNKRLQKQFTHTHNGTGWERMQTFRASEIRAKNVLEK